MIILGYMHNDKRKCFFMQNLLVAATFSLGNELIFSQIEGGLHLDFQHEPVFHGAAQMCPHSQHYVKL